MIADTENVAPDNDPQNLVYLQSVQLTYCPQGTVKYGYLLSDDYDRDFGILDHLYSGLDLLQQLFLSDSSFRGDNALAIMDEAVEVGLYINGQWFDWEKIKHIWMAEPANCECDG